MAAARDGPDASAHPMGLTVATQPRIVSLLDVDSELAQAVPETERHEARRHAAVPALQIAGRRWDPSTIAMQANAGWLGVFVLDGLLLRHVSVAGRSSGELLGAGDVFRSWDADDEYAPLPVTVEWAVLAPTRVAVLDDAFARRIAHWPHLWGKLLHRTSRRANHQAVIAAVTTLTRSDERLLLMFWLLAGRWGRMTPDGVLLTLPLTHRILALLIGANRPTVTTALNRLAANGLLLRLSRDRWLLTHAAMTQIRYPERLTPLTVSQGR